MTEITDEIRRLARWFNLAPDQEADWPVDLFKRLLELRPYLESKIWFDLLYGILNNWDTAITREREAKVE